MRTTAFARLSYCEQVRLAAGAQLLVGVHGQGITNGQFLRDDAWALELFTVESNRIGAALSISATSHFTELPVYGTWLHR